MNFRPSCVVPAFIHQSINPLIQRRSLATLFSVLHLLRERVKVSRSVCSVSSVVLGALLLTGCAGYKLGPTNGLAAGEKSVQVEPFANQTLEPRLTDAVTAQVRKQLQRDGTFRLATRDDGDIVMTGVITRYNRHELSFAPRDTLTVRDYRLSLTAQVSARDRSTGRMILDQPVTGYTLIRVGTDLTSSEKQALPLLAADLAKNVANLLADGSW